MKFTDPVVRTFADRHKITPSQVKRLVAMADIAAEAQTDWHNGGPESIMKLHCGKFEEYANRLGFTVDWNPGLYPLLKKDGVEEHLPEDK